ncbi:MAG: YigZ family protein [Clostridia bacterium]|nr:YigZ family protein [Clostridia bacterium]
MEDRYLTVKKQSEAEQTIKRSHFIATVKPIKTEEEALSLINSLKQKYWDARHNVYAYILRENNIMRYSDDGEPAGTGGVPVLDMLKKEGLTDIIVVVTRYFGGILLGTGGLVHAYSSTARQGVDQAGRLLMIRCKSLTLTCDYTLWGKVQNELSAFTHSALPPEYSDIVKATVYIPTEDANRLEKTLIEATNGKISLSFGEDDFFAFEE